MNCFFAIIILSFKNINYKIILVFILFFFSKEYIIQPINNSYPKVKELPSGDLFIIMNNGIYISNNNISNLTKIYQFNTEETIKKNSDDNKTVLSEFKDDNNLYILGLVKEYLYLYDYNKAKLSKYNLTSELNGNFYDLIPYKITNNSLYYIIVFAKQIKENCKNYNFDTNALHFMSYKIDFSLEENNNTLICNGSYYDFIESLLVCYSYISDLYFSCQIISEKYLICFYLTDNSKKLRISKFDIDNNFKKDKTFNNYYSNRKEVSNIKSSVSSETNNLLVCIEYKYTYSEGYLFNKKYYTYMVSKCLIFDINNKKFNKIVTKYNMNNFKLNYFHEEKMLILAFNNFQNKTSFYYFNETTFSFVNYHEENFTECKIINSFSLQYKDSETGYNLISDCITEKNPNKWNIIYNVSMFGEFSPIINPPEELIIEDDDETEEEDEYEYEDEESIDINIEDCEFYYYLRLDGQYRCTKTDKCPNDYDKLIEEKKQCIDNCTKDDTFIYLYEDKCVFDCPSTAPYEIPLYKACTADCMAADFFQIYAK